MRFGEPVMFRQCEKVVDKRFGEAAGRLPSTAIVEAVALATGKKPTDGSPLYEYIDPDAIDRLFAETPRKQSDILLTFRMDQWLIFVSGNGFVRICDTTRRADPAPVFE